MLPIAGPIFDPSIQESNSRDHHDQVSSLWNPNSVSLLYDAAGGSSSCSLQCDDNDSNDNGPFKFEPGQGYTYDYSVVSSTLMKGTSSQESRAEIRASIEIRPESACDFRLKVCADDQNLFLMRGQLLPQKKP